MFRTRVRVKEAAVIWLVLFGCGPKKPPVGSVLVEAPPAGAVVSAVEVDPGATDAPVASVDRPLAYGNGLPWLGDAVTPEQQALLKAEALLADLERTPLPRSPIESQEQAGDALDVAQEALSWLATSSRDSSLRVPSAARAGDAWRLAAHASHGVAPPMDLPMRRHPEFRAQVELAVVPLAEKARAAYERVITDLSADPTWQSHARWGLASIEELL